MAEDGLRERIRDQMGRVKDDLAELVAIRSVADPKLYPPEECARAAQWVIDAFRDAGVRDTGLLYASGRGLAPTAEPGLAVYGERPGPRGAPTVLLYAHYDVAPPVDDGAWKTPPFELSEQDGRWYGRGAADCKGNILMHLTALRALGNDVPVTLKVLIGGQHEPGTGGLERFIASHVDLLQADAFVVCDVGNAAVGVPTVTTTLRGMTTVDVRIDALAAPVPAGRFAGAVPDPLAALIQILATLRDARGNTTIAGLPTPARWSGIAYAMTQFRRDAAVLDGVQLLGDASVADMVWARPALTVLGIDCFSADASATTIQPTARARLGLLVPPGLDPAATVAALVAQVESQAPWGVRVRVESAAPGPAFEAATTGPAFGALREAVVQAYGKQLATQGMGGQIPLCSTLAATYPTAEIILIGVEEPRSQAHAPNESVDPSEIENMALAEALFLRHYATVAI